MGSSNFATTTAIQDNKRSGMNARPLSPNSLTSRTQTNTLEMTLCQNCDVLKIEIKSSQKLIRDKDSMCSQLKAEQGRLQTLLGNA
jgi:hypothetical protein